MRVGIEGGKGSREREAFKACFLSTDYCLLTTVYFFPFFFFLS
jgi:hypothetical protein